MRVIIVVGIVLVLVGLLGGLGANRVAPDRYTGKEVFLTEQSYTSFKEVVGAKGIDITQLVVLSSNPPIVVSYDVWVKKGVEFPYGTRHTLESWILPFLLGGMGLVLLLVMGATYLLERGREDTE